MSVTKRKNLKKKMIGFLCFAIIASGMAAAPDVPCLSGIGAVSVSAEEADPVYVSEVSLGQIVSYANSPESCPTGVTAQYVNSDNTIELTLTNSGTYKFSGSNYINGSYVDVQIIVPSDVNAEIVFADGSSIVNDEGGVYTTTGEILDYTVPFKVEAGGSLTLTGKLCVDTYSHMDKNAPLYEGEGTFTADISTVTYVDFILNEWDESVETATDEQYYLNGSKSIKPADPQKYDCIFFGWYTDKECTTPYDFTSAVTGNVTLYPKWLAESEMVESEVDLGQIVDYANGFVSQAGVSAEFSDTNTSTIELTLTKSGTYKFSGSNYTNSSYFDVQIVVPTDVFAAVEFADGSSIINDEGNYSVTTGISGYTVPFRVEKGGYLTVTGDLFVDTYSYMDQNIPLSEGNGTFTADYFTVKYVDDDGQTVDEQYYLNGSKSVKPADPVKEGYAFGGWYTDAACTTPYDFTSAVEGNVTLYPKWLAEVDLSKIIDYRNSTTASPAGVTVRTSQCKDYWGDICDFSDDIIEIVLDESRTYKFKGSNYINGSYVDVKIIVPSGVTADVEFAKGSTIKNDHGKYAYTADQYNYSKMVFSGKCGIYDYAVPFKVEGTLTVSGDLSVDTYSYYGSCSSRYNHGKHGASAPLYEGTGTFTADYFTVKYVDEDDLTVDEQYFIGGERNVMPTQLALGNLTCLVADGKSFKSGGTLSKDTTVKNHLDTDLNGECDICTAAIMRTVTFNTNGGSTIEAKSIRFGGTISAPTAPTKEGYTFGGWYTDEACTTPFDFGSAITENMTLYAKWIVEVNMNELLAECVKSGEFFEYGILASYSNFGDGNKDLQILLGEENTTYKFTGSNMADDEYIDVTIRLNCDAVNVEFDNASIINSVYRFDSDKFNGNIPFIAWNENKLNVSGTLSVDTAAYYDGSESSVTELLSENEGGKITGNFFEVTFVDEAGIVIDKNYYLGGNGQKYDVKPSSYVGADKKLHNIADEFLCVPSVVENVSGETTITAKNAHADENSDHKCDNCGISAKLTGIELITAPTKTNYYIGQTLDPTGGQIIVSYEFGKDKTVDITADMVSGFDNKKEGKQTLTVTYGEKTVTFDVTVSVAKMTGIEVTTKPKTSYFIGEKLDVTGGKITVTYEDGKTETVDLTADMVSGFDSTKAGTKTLTVTYSGKTTTFDVTVAAAKVSGIEITSLPTKTSYAAGDKLDVTGGKIKATYEDGKTETVDLTAAMVSGFDSTKAGKQTLTVTYGGKTATFDITVTAELDKPVISAVKTGDGQVTVSWNAVKNAASYKVYYRLNGTTSWTTKSTTATSYTITGLTNDKKYDILVVAFNGSVNSKWTNADIINATPAAAVTAPSLPTAKATAGDAQVALSWNAVSNATAYKVYYRLNGTTSWSSKSTTATSLTITGLTNGKKYDFLVVAFNGTVSSKWTNADIINATPAAKVTAPALPTVKATAGDAQVALSWNAVSNATSYKVYYRLNGTSKWASKGTTATSLTITGLTNGKKYDFLVVAFNGTVSSKWTNADIINATPAAAVTAPALPTVKATAGDAQVALSWNAVSNATSYKVYYRLNGTSKWASKGTTATSLTITGLTNGKKYDFLVVAFNGTVSSKWTNADIINATPVAAAVAKPALPTGLTLAAGDGKITASWNAVNGASYYTVYTYYNGKYTKVGTPVSTRFTITGLTNNTKYGVLVLATNKAGSSDFTKNDVKFATPIVAEKPALPTGLKLAAGDGKITAAWNPVSGASHYTVYTYYNGKYHKVGTPVSTRYTITGLTNNTKYGVLVLATNKAGNSDFTKYDVKFATPVSSEKPALPTVKAAAGNAKVALSWNAVPNATGYKVYYRLNGTSKWTSKGTTGTSLTISGLTNGKKYDFLVVAFNGSLSSSWTNSDIIYSYPPTNPPTPKNGAASFLTQLQITTNNSNQLQVQVTPNNSNS